MDTLLYWDEQVFYWVFEGWRANWLTPVMIFFSDALKATPMQVAVLLAWGWMVWRGGKLRRFALLLIPTLILTNETSDLLKAWVGRERPCVALPIEAITGKLTSGSFPSAHSANTSAVAALAGAIGSWRQAAFWGWLPIIAGISRVYVGVHYPSDVLAGWALGAFYGWGVAWLWRKITALLVSTLSTAESSKRGE